MMHLRIPAIVFGLMASGCSLLRSDQECEELCASLARCGYLPSVLGAGTSNDQAEQNCRTRCLATPEEDSDRSQVLACTEDHAESCNGLRDCLSEAVPTGFITGASPARLRIVEKVSGEAPHTASCSEPVSSNPSAPASLCGDDSTPSAPRIQAIGLRGPSVGLGPVATQSCTEALTTPLLLERVQAGEVAPELKVVFAPGVSSEPATPPAAEDAPTPGCVFLRGPIQQVCAGPEVDTLVVEADLDGARSNRSCEASCNNGLDDDDDGWVDCVDAACADLCARCAPEASPGLDPCSNPLCFDFCPSSQEGASGAPGAPEEKP